MEDNQPVVLIVDESQECKGLDAILKRGGFNVAFLDPTEDFTASTNQYHFRAVIYEPYFVIGSQGRRFRPILDDIINRARNDGAKIVALTSQQKMTLEEEGIYEGKHYDTFLRKPTRPQTVVAALIQ